MTSAAQGNRLVDAFQDAFIRLIHLVIPAYDAGMWNYLFEPAPNGTGSNDPRLLQATNLTYQGQWSRTIQNLLIQPYNSLDVFAWVTSDGTGANTALAKILSQPRHMFLVCVVMSVVLLIALLFTVATLLIPFCCWDEGCVCLPTRNSACACIGCDKSSPVLEMGGASGGGGGGGVIRRIRSHGNLALPPSYLNDEPRRTLSIGSVRQCLHNPRIGQWAANADSPASSDLYVNDPTIVGRRGQPRPDPVWNIPLRRNSSVDTLPLGSEARLCQYPRDFTDPVDLTPSKREALSWRAKNAKRVHYALFALNWIFILFLLIGYILLGYALDRVYLFAKPTDNPPDTVQTLQQSIVAIMNGAASFLLEIVSQGQAATADTVEGLQKQVTMRQSICATDQTQSCRRIMSEEVAPVREFCLLNNLVDLRCSVICETTRLPFMSRGNSCTGAPWFLISRFA
ncbi:unnamed protein product [Echinostoma caproni]|uniref:Uncharacterized protein n=1 Tax=Echinostoma caproni TaxID=27848 RepID=A0A183ARJ0_9TREM|nr:unnamed protein product [Echinostoma caproni]